MATATRTVRIRFDGTTKGLAGAVARANVIMRQFDDGVSNGHRTWVKFSNATGRATKGLAKAAAAVGTLASGLGVLGASASSIAALSGVIGLLPGVAFAAVGAFAAAKLGAEGAQRAFERLQPTLDDLRSKVSAAFERSLTPAVSNLRKVLPQLQGRLSGVASEMGNVATRFTGMLAESQNVNGLNAILASTRTVVGNLGNALAPLGSAFITIGRVATNEFANLTRGAESAAERFKAFVEQAAVDGRLQAWIQRAVQAFRNLWDTLKDIGAIIGQVFGALQAEGIGVTGVFSAAVKSVREFLESAQGQEVLQSLAKAISTVATAVGTVLDEALKAVGPAIPDLARAFSQLIMTLTPAFVAVVRTFGAALSSVASFAAQNMSWLGPLTLVIIGIATAVKGFTMALTAWRAVVTIVTAAQWLWNAAMAANPIGLVIAAIAALVAAFTWLWNHSAGFRDFFIGLWNKIKQAVGAVVSWFKSAWQGAWNFVTSLWGRITGFFSGIWNNVRSFASNAANGVRNVWNSAVNGIRGFFSGLASFAGGIWNGIVSGVKAAINSVLGVINGAINGVNAVTGIVGVPSIPNIPYLAKGGTAIANRPYIVGERGPELMIPGRTGRVVNANTTAEALGTGAGTNVQVFIDGQEFRGMIRTEISENNRQAGRKVASRGGVR